MISVARGFAGLISPLRPVEMDLVLGPGAEPTLEIERRLGR